MKKLVQIIASIAIFMAFTACSQDGKKGEIIIGATPVPHAEILKFAAPLFEKRGYTLKVVEFTDYAVPNKALHEGQLDANFFQHKPYMDEFNKSNGTEVVATQSVVIVPMGAYSRHLKDIKELKDGALISVPNDPTNEDRAFILLEREGLLEFKPGTQFKTPKDIAKNPKNLKFTELKAAQLPRSLDDVDLAFIPTNYALDFGLSPVKEALLIEDKDSPYAIIIAVRKNDENAEKSMIISEILRSKEVKDFVEQKYGGNVLTTF